MCKHRVLKSEQILLGCKLSEEELIFFLFVCYLSPCVLEKAYCGFRISLQSGVRFLRKGQNALAFTLHHCPLPVAAISLSTDQCLRLMRNDRNCLHWVYVINSSKVPWHVQLCGVCWIATESEQSRVALILMVLLRPLTNFYQTDYLWGKVLNLFLPWGVDLYSLRKW